MKLTWQIVILLLIEHMEAIRHRAQSAINLGYNFSFGGFVEPDPASAVP
jgi:hypothetical protein